MDSAARRPALDQATRDLIDKNRKLAEKLARCKKANTDLDQEKSVLSASLYERDQQLVKAYAAISELQTRIKMLKNAQGLREDLDKRMEAQISYLLLLHHRSQDGLLSAAEVEDHLTNDSFRLELMDRGDKTRSLMPFQSPKPPKLSEEDKENQSMFKLGTSPAPAFRRSPLQKSVLFRTQTNATRAPLAETTKARLNIR